MTVLGFMHGGGARGHHALGGHGPADAHAHTLGGHQTHALAGHQTASANSATGHHSSTVPAKADGADVRAKSFPAWLMISPMDIFSFSLGAGAAGMLFHAIVSPVLLPWIAVIGALVFNLGIAKPMMALTMKFVSKPSEGLEGVVAHTAQAMTRFDERGRGLVSLTLDDQNVQLLAHLEDAELHRGVQVNKGDEVVVIEVDSAKNSCRISKEL